MISVRQLTKKYGDSTAVDSLTFDIAAGSVCALLGPNGAGKSTAVKMLCGLLRPDGGSASAAGIDSASGGHALRRAIGVVPETLGLFDSLTVREHLELSGAVHGLDAQETAARASGLLAALALEHGRDTFASDCSYGMRKKTALALALLHDPKVLFLDEPFEGVDPVTAKTIRGIIVSLARRGVTVLLTSHILAFVSEVAERVLFLRQGKLVWDSESTGIPAELEQRYFDLVEAPPPVELPWLGSSRS